MIQWWNEFLWNRSLGWGDSLYIYTWHDNKATYRNVYVIHSDTVPIDGCTLFCLFCFHSRSGHSVHHVFLHSTQYHVTEIVIIIVTTIVIANNIAIGIHVESWNSHRLLNKNGWCNIHYSPSLLGGQKSPVFQQFGHVNIANWHSHSLRDTKKQQALLP